MPIADTEPNSQWISKPKQDAAVNLFMAFCPTLFLAGVLMEVYWPEMLSRDDQLARVGVYASSYRADALAGTTVSETLPRRSTPILT